MQEIRKYLERTRKLSDADWERFSSGLIRRQFGPRSVILKAGEREEYLSFMEKGIVRFYVPGEERDLTFSFAFAGAFMSAYDSFLSRAACAYQVETLTPATLWSVSHAQLQTVYRETAIGNLIGREAAEELFLAKSRRELSLLSETAEERYRKLLSEQPRLLQLIPLKYLASYIGITPQALSRIRRRIS